MRQEQFNDLITVLSERGCVINRFHYDSNSAYIEYEEYWGSLGKFSLIIKRNPTKVESPEEDLSPLVKLLVREFNQLARLEKEGFFQNQDKPVEGEKR